MRRAALAALACVALLALFASRGAAQGSIKVSGSPTTLAIRSTAAAGLAPTSVTESSTTYSIKAPGDKSGPSKVTAQLNASMPNGLTLTLSAPATPGGTSYGAVALDATARDIITGIAGFGGTATNSFTYTLSATSAAGVVPLQSRTVTLTIVAAP